MFRAGISGFRDSSGALSLDLANKDLASGFTLDGVALADQTWVNTQISSSTPLKLTPVDAVITNLDAYTYNNGAGTITMDAIQTWDTADSDDVDINTTTTKRVLLLSSATTVGITDNAHAGVYDMTTASDGASTYTVFTRATDVDTSAEWLKGITVMVLVGGTSCANKEYQYQGDSNPTLGTDSLVMVYSGEFTVGSVADSQIVSVSATKLTGSIDDARVTESSVTQHAGALNLAASQISSGTMVDARIAESNVTQHEAALSITFSQLSDSVTAVTEAAVTAHEAALTLATTQVTSGTFADARISESSVTQHEAALSIATSQLSGTINYDTQMSNAPRFKVSNLGPSHADLITAKSFCYYDSVSSQVKEADEDTTEPVFYSLSGTIVENQSVVVDTSRVQSFGLRVKTGVTLAAYDKLYLSDEAGKVTNVAPTTKKARYVGYVIDATVGFEEFVLEPTIMGDNSIDGTEILADSIDSEHYVAGSIDSEHYAAGSVDGTALGADAVDGSHIGDDVINTEHYVAGSVDRTAMDSTLLDDLENNVAKTFKVTVNFNDSFPVDIIAAANLASGDDIYDLSIDPTTTFDGSATLTFGTASTTTSSVSGSSDWDLSSSTKQDVKPLYAMTAAEALQCTVGGSPTQGVVVIRATKISY